MTEFDQFKNALDRFTPEATEANAIKAIKLAKESFIAHQESAHLERHTDIEINWMARLIMKAEFIKRTFLSPWGIAGSSSLAAFGLAVIIIQSESFTGPATVFSKRDSALNEIVAAEPSVKNNDEAAILAASPPPTATTQEIISGKIKGATVELQDYVTRQAENLSEFSKSSLSIAENSVQSLKQKSALIAQELGARAHVPLSSSELSATPNSSDWISNNRYPEFGSNRNVVTEEMPISTFSVDTDTASYSYVRSSLLNGQLPNQASVRIEELINYFDYSYPKPTGDHPFSINVLVTENPWNVNTKLAHVGIQGIDLASEKRQPSDLVFLIDTSGSMGAQNKLPLLKQSFKIMLDELRTEDTVSIITYAGSTALLLEPTSADNQSEIYAALDMLDANGSTAGESGLKLAYQQAAKMRGIGRTSRVIIATDGDFNVGISDPIELKNEISEQRKNGTFLSVLGFGSTGINDAVMQSLAQNGNGTAYHIDTFAEAKKVLSDEILGTLFTIAKDVKIQVEFNPAKIAEYRLIGYETRKLERSDFNNDQVDAGEIGAGHTVTAIYEITPIGSSAVTVDPLRYRSKLDDDIYVQSEELGYLKLRYKLPDVKNSLLITKPIKNELVDFDINTGFATAIAWFGQVLRNEPALNDNNILKIVEMAKKFIGSDGLGFKAEAVKLMGYASSLK